MVLERKKQGVISGSMTWKNREYIEIFDRDYKYLYGEVEDLFIAYGTWVEYDVIDAPAGHPKNCLREAVNVNMDVKKSNAPTTDEFGKTAMNVRDFNKVDFFQYNTEGGQLTHKSTVRCNVATGNYFNEYYGEVIMSRDARNRLTQFRINSVDVMLNLIPSDKYGGSGPHWEVTHFINQGKMYSINGYLSILGLVLRGPGGVVRNRSDVTIPPDSLRPVQNARPQQSASSESNWENSITLNHEEKNKLTNTAIRGFETSDDQWKKSASTNSSTEPVNNIKPRGLGNFGFGAFGESGVTKPTSTGPENVKREMFGVQNSETTQGPSVTTQKPLVAKAQPRQIGFGTSSGSFGVSEVPQRNASEFRATSGSFGASAGTFGASRRAAGMSFGTFGTSTTESRVKAPVHVMDADDFEIPELASDVSRIQSFEKMNLKGDKKNAIADKTPATKKPNENVFEDDWGEQSSSMRPHTPQRTSNFQLPPQSKKPGLARYSNSNF